MIKVIVTGALVSSLVFFVWKGAVNNPRDPDPIYHCRNIQYRHAGLDNETQAAYEKMILDTCLREHGELPVNTPLHQR
jgi:hypothetical protein